MKENTLVQFIKKHATSHNLSYYYTSYPKEVQEMLNNVFKGCWRFGLYASQTLYILDEALKPFDNQKTDLNFLLGDDE